jgi:hypothetical protein
VITLGKSVNQNKNFHLFEVDKELDYLYIDSQEQLDSICENELSKERILGVDLEFTSI